MGVTLYHANISLLLLSLKRFDSSRPQQLVSTTKLSYQSSAESQLRLLSPERTYSRRHAIVRPDSYNSFQLLSLGVIWQIMLALPAS